MKCHFLEMQKKTWQGIVAMLKIAIEAIFVVLFSSSLGETNKFLFLNDVLSFDIFCFSHNFLFGIHVNDIS